MLGLLRFSKCLVTFLQAAVIVILCLLMAFDSLSPMDLIVKGVLLVHMAVALFGYIFEKKIIMIGHIWINYVLMVVTLFWAGYRYGNWSWELSGFPVTAENIMVHSLCGLVLFFDILIYTMFCLIFVKLMTIQKRALPQHRALLESNEDYPVYTKSVYPKL